MALVRRISEFDKEYSPAIPGICVLFVILDHNDILRNIRSLNDWFKPPTFHVAGFLLHPFLVPTRPLTIILARDRAVRDLVPFIVAVNIYVIAFFLYSGDVQKPSDVFNNYVVALLIASTVVLHTASGFVVLWFTPALLTTVLLILLSDSLGPAWRPVIFAVAALLHLTVGGYSEVIKAGVPQGILITLYIFPIGLIARHIAVWPTLKQRRFAVAAVSFAAVIAAGLPLFGVEVDRHTSVARFRRSAGGPRLGCKQSCFFGSGPCSRS